MNDSTAQLVERFQTELSALEAEMAQRKRALIERLAELLGVPVGAATGKIGRPFGDLAAQPPARVVGKRGRKPACEGTLPGAIAKVLAAAERPLNAKEILASLQATGWKSRSGDPGMMVRKALYRIEKFGVVRKAARGKFVAPGAN